MKLVDGNVWKTNERLVSEGDMTITEILKEIDKERVHIEVYQALHQWLLDDRKEWIDRAMESEATVRAVRDIATKVKNPKGAIEGIIGLCTDE